MLALTDIWPLFNLRITSPRLELRVARDEDLPGIVDAALSGIHDPAVMPFSVPWTDAPREALIRNTVKHQWRIRAAVEPDDWTLNFVVKHEGIPIGMQSVIGQEFSVRRTVATASWMARGHQGKGLGKEMRQAVLLFAFDHLGAEVAETSAAVWNASSLGVSRSIGYTLTGIKRVVTRPGQLTEQQEAQLTPSEFKRPNWNVQIIGAEVAKTELIRQDSA